MPIKFNLKKYLNPVFIETGTYFGNGINTALSVGFKKVYSIELDVSLYVAASEKFKGNNDVIIKYGDSKNELRNILSKINKPVTFWLDAHIQKNQIDRIIFDSMCPLEDELNAILDHNIKTHTILIDDLRIIKSGDGWGKNVNLNKILEFVKSKNSNFTVSYEDGIIPNDVLVLKFFK